MEILFSLFYRKHLLPMTKKSFIRECCSILLVYVVVAVIISVFVYEVTTYFLQTGALNFDKGFLKNMISDSIGALLGVIVGSFVFLLLSKSEDLNKKMKKASDSMNKNLSKYFWKNILLFEIMGLIGKITKNLLDTLDNGVTVHSLFSSTFLAGYSGIILAMTVFAIMFTYGLKKQLESKTEK